MKIFIDMSTTGATYAKRIAAGLAAKNIAAVDAPVSGGLTGAAERNAGGDGVLLREGPSPVKPVLGHLGKLF